MSQPKLSYLSTNFRIQKCKKPNKSKCVNCLSSGKPFENEVNDTVWVMIN